MTDDSIRCNGADDDGDSPTMPCLALPQASHSSFSSSTKHSSSSDAVPSLEDTVDDVNDDESMPIASTVVNHSTQDTETITLAPSTAMEDTMSDSMIPVVARAETAVKRASRIQKELNDLQKHDDKQRRLSGTTYVKDNNRSGPVSTFIDGIATRKMISGLSGSQGRFDQAEANNKRDAELRRREAKAQEKADREAKAAERAEKAREKLKAELKQSQQSKSRSSSRCGAAPKGNKKNIKSKEQEEQEEDEDIDIAFGLGTAAPAPPPPTRSSQARIAVPAPAATTTRTTNVRGSKRGRSPPAVDNGGDDLPVDINPPRPVSAPPSRRPPPRATQGERVGGARSNIDNNGMP